MSNNGQPPEDTETRILRFRHRRSDELAKPDEGESAGDLKRYEQDGSVDDYRHRMLVNFAALMLIVALIGAGVWIVNTMADLRKNQDCALQGRRNCAPIDVNREPR
ncbi:MAG: hypothetical protein AB7O50_06210 [Pseudolabrys sp.]